MSSSWEQLADPDGRPYYYNHTTGDTQWSDPSEDAAAAVAEELPSRDPTSGNDGANAHTQRGADATLADIKVDVDGAKAVSSPPSGSQPAAAAAQSEEAAAAEARAPEDVVDIVDELLRKDAAAQAAATASSQRHQAEAEASAARQHQQELSPVVQIVRTSAMPALKSVSTAAAQGTKRGNRGKRSTRYQSKRCRDGPQKRRRGPRGGGSRRPKASTQQAAVSHLQELGFDDVYHMEGDRPSADELLLQQQQQHDDDDDDDVAYYDGRVRRRESGGAQVQVQLPQVSPSRSPVTAGTRRSSAPSPARALGTFGYAEAQETSASRPRRGSLRSVLPQPRRRRSQGKQQQQQQRRRRRRSDMGSTSAARRPPPATHASSLALRLQRRGLILSDEAAATDEFGLEYSATGTSGGGGGGGGGRPMSNTGINHLDGIMQAPLDRVRQHDSVDAFGSPVDVSAAVARPSPVGGGGDHALSHAAARDAVALAAGSAGTGEAVLTQSELNELLVMALDGSVPDIPPAQLLQLRRAAMETRARVLGTAGFDAGRSPVHMDTAFDVSTAGSPQGRNLGATWGVGSATGVPSPSYSSSSSSNPNGAPSPVTHAAGPAAVRAQASATVDAMWASQSRSQGPRSPVAYQTPASRQRDATLADARDFLDRLRRDQGRPPRVSKRMGRAPKTKKRVGTRRRSAASKAGSSKRGARRAQAARRRSSSPTRVSTMHRKYEQQFGL